MSATSAIAPDKPLFISAADMLARPVVVKPLLGRVIERGCTGQLFGPSGDGKTFVVLDMALAVGTGGTWHRHQCEKGLVLYFAGEGHAGLGRRINAWSRHNGNPDLANVNVSASVISFDADGIDSVIAEARMLEDCAGPVALIVIDTLARHINGDENSTRDMGDFVRGVDGLRDAFPGSTAIIVHHTGNNAENAFRSRGSSALKAAMDFEIRCTDGQLTFTKAKDAEALPPIDFKLMPVEVGRDEDGEPITSCVVAYGERSAKNRQTKGMRLSSGEKTLLNIITEPITVDCARTEYVRQKTAIDSCVKANTVRRAFSRTLESLVEKGEVFINGGTLSRGQTGQEGTFTTFVPPSEGTTGDTTLKGCPICPQGPLQVFEEKSEEAEAFSESDIFAENLPF